VNEKSLAHWGLLRQKQTGCDILVFCGGLISGRCRHQKLQAYRAEWLTAGELGGIWKEVMVIRTDVSIILPSSGRTNNNKAKHQSVQMVVGRFSNLV
jgi:hypothetical protein